MDYETTKIEVRASAIRPAMEPGFYHDWPDGSREHGVVMFESPVVLRDSDGVRERPAGTWIVYRPHEPRYYRAIHGRLVHTWILAEGPGIERCLESYQIPSSLGFDFGGLDFMENFIKEVRHEQLNLQPYFEDAITDLCWEFFRRAGAVIAENYVPRTARHYRKMEKFREIRTRVHNELSKRWTVQDMADLADMNPTRFAMDYQAYFGDSPIDDLINARMRSAEHLLKNHALSIKQIAAECGFGSPEHFNRLFHSRRGCSPGRYRRL